MIKALNGRGSSHGSHVRFDYNGDMLAAVDNKAKVIIANNIPGLGALAYKTAIEFSRAQIPPKHVLVDPLFLATDTSIDVGVPVEKIVLGVNAWRDMPYGFDGRSCRRTSRCS